MSQSNRPKPSLLQAPCRVVPTAAALATAVAATIIGVGCVTPTPSSSPAVAAPATAPAPTATTRQTPTNAAPNTGQASLVQAQGGGRSRFVPAHWQESDAILKELPSAEGDDADPAVQSISIGFSGGFEAANGVVSGYSGCNRPSGPYERLTSGMCFGDLVSTYMAYDSIRVELETVFLEALKPPLTTVGIQPSAGDRQGCQVIWKTTSGALLQFAERPLPSRGQTH